MHTSESDSKPILFNGPEVRKGAARVGVKGLVVAGEVDEEE